MASKKETASAPETAASRPGVLPVRPEREVKSIEQLAPEKIAEIEAAVPKNWVVDDAGQAFPPYWQPGVGKFFRGTPLYRDERDIDFMRWHIEATIPTLCFRGNEENREIITVQPGEIYTVSGCKGLLLERYVGFEIMALVTSVDPLPGNEASGWQPRDFYRFKVMTSAENNKQLREVRQTVRKQMIEMAKKKALDNMLRIAAGQMSSNAA